MLMPNEHVGVRAELLHSLGKMRVHLPEFRRAYHEHAYHAGRRFVVKRVILPESAPSPLPAVSLHNKSGVKKSLFFSQTYSKHNNTKRYCINIFMRKVYNRKLTETKGKIT